MPVRNGTELRSLSVEQAGSEPPRRRLESFVRASVPGEAEEQSVTAERLYRIANAALRRALTRLPSDYDDLLQVVVERVLRSLRAGSFSGECSLPTWVAVIANHAAIDWARSSSRGRATLELIADPEALGNEATRASRGPEPHLEARSLLRHAERVLRDMTPAYRETLILHHVHGYDLTEIALVSRVSIAAAQSRLARGRHELRRRLGIALGVEATEPAASPARARSCGPKSSRA